MKFPRKLLILGIDVDETIAELHRPWMNWGNRVFGTNVREFDCWAAPEKHWGKEAYQFLNPHTYDNIDRASERVYPIKGALKTVELLRTLGHQIRFVTSCVNGSEESKLNWLTRYGFIVNSPSQIAREFMPMRDKSIAPVDVLVDDGYHNCQAFGFTRSVLVTAPHNWEQQGATPEMAEISHISELPGMLQRFEHL